MSNFIKSASSRETSTEIMEAILKVANGNELVAETIWEHPTESNLSAIIEIVTDGGAYETTDFVWGADGDDWAE